MKIEKSKSKKNVGDLPSATKELTQRLLSCSDEELVKELKSVSVWRYGKCELYHWTEVLDRFDAILSGVTHHEPGAGCIFMCPKLVDPKVKQQVLSILNFTALLIEHSYARHIYNSMEHLCALLASTDLVIILAVLNLLYVFGKRSNFISRLPAQQRNSLNSYLEYLGETWGGEQNGFGLAKCCRDVGLDQFPDTATSVYFELQPSEYSMEMAQGKADAGRSLHLSRVDQWVESTAELMQQLVSTHRIPLNHQMRLLTRLRLAKSFADHQLRIQCVLVRLQAISVLVYSMAPADLVDPLIYDGFVEELVEVLEIKETVLSHEVKAAVLRTLTAIIHLERDPRLGVIIEATGASMYHGFLPMLVRECVTAITCAGPDGSSHVFPLYFATSLFSFLYHLATYENSGDALVSSGIMESLLQVLEWKAVLPMNITLVTRAVRVVDLITNLDMTAFHSLGGWEKMLDRLECEVAECRSEAPHVLPMAVNSASVLVPMDTSLPESGSSLSVEMVDGSAAAAASSVGQCMPERSALIKSILNFLKKAIPDPTFADNIRNFVDSSLPRSLAHIVSNAEYYGPSIYLPATEVTTTFIFHDPSQLSSLQDNGLPWIVLNSLISKKIPVTREVLSALPSILSAICLNNRGLQAFIDAKPFDHLFSVLTSPEYLPAMRRKRGAEQSGDTASNLGAAMDELMRHQPLLRDSVMTALINLLTKLCKMGTTTGGVDSAQQALPLPKEASSARMISDSEEDEEEVVSPASEKTGREEEDEEESLKSSAKSGKETSQPLAEYVLNVVHFVDAILSNNSTDDHIREFVMHGGLKPLLSLLSLPVLPLDFPTSSSCSSITTTCRSILNIAHEGKLLEEALTQLQAVLTELSPFIESPQQAKGSVLLKEVESVSSLHQSFLMHKLAAAGAYIQLFIYLSKSGQLESRQLCVSYWSSSLGETVLGQLSSLYRALVWEGFIVLAAASDREESIETSKKGPSGKATALEEKAAEQANDAGNVDDALYMASPPLPLTLIPSEKGETTTRALSQALRHFTPPLAVTSRVGRSLAELMSLLVRLSTGPLHRPFRRGLGDGPYHPPSEDAITVCMHVSELLVQSLTWNVPTPVDCGFITESLMKDWLFTGMTFKMYAVDFCLLLLFDEHKQAYHLMLHAFDQKRVMDSFIDSFHAAMEYVNLAHQDSQNFVGVADAVTSDFLEAWLNLAEKLVNASAILDSSHVLPVPPPSQAGGAKLMFNPLFNPLAFVIKAQKAILPCIEELWKPENLKWVVPEVVEHILATVCEFYTSEKVIQNKLKEFHSRGAESSSKDGGAGSSSQLSAGSQSSLGPPPLPQADPRHMQQLMDMGFNREHAEEALVMCGGNLTAAMDWILTHPPPVPTATAASHSQEVALSEEEQIMRAIALSLGQELPPPSTTQTRPKDASAMEEEGAKEKEEKREEAMEADVLTPLDTAVLDRLGDSLLEGTLGIVPNHVRGAVHRTCSLVCALVKRNGHDWKRSVLTRVKDEVASTVEGLIRRIVNGTYVIMGDVLDPDAFYITLLALLLKEMNLDCADVVCHPDLISSCTRLLSLTCEKLPMLKRDECSTPLWVAPLMLILEQCEGIARMSKWKVLPGKDSQAAWMWFESMNGRWCHYPPDVMKKIEKSYREGEDCYRVLTGRQRYLVQFDTMVQVNQDTGTSRPVLRIGIPGSGKQTSSASSDIREARKVSCQLSEEQGETVVRCCTRLLSQELHSSALHANARLLLRLTRCRRLSDVFVSERGPQSLLTLTQKSSFQGVIALSTLLFRHVMEEGPLLEQAVESMVKAVISGNYYDGKEMKPHGMGRKDLDYVLRQLSPCVARNPTLFLEVAAGVLRLNQLPPKPEDYLSTPHTQPTLLRFVGVPQLSSVTLSPAQLDLLNLLIDQLCADAFPEEDMLDHKSQGMSKMDEDDGSGVGVQFPASAIGRIGSRQTVRPRRSSYRRQMPETEDDDDRSEDMVLDSDPVSESRPSQQSHHAAGRAAAGASAKKSPSASTVTTGEEETEKKRECLLLSQASILRLLAELINSYPACALTVIESTRKIRIGKQTAKEVSILAFILDHLLPASYTQGSSASNVSKLAKAFLQCLATTALPMDALMVFVTEFRAAFSRSLVLPESHLKHFRIRAMAGLLAHIVDPQVNMSPRAVNPSQFVRMLIRKGIITDLSKAVHSLELGSPLLMVTMNSLLKPLESMTKIITQFMASQKKTESAGATHPVSSPGQQRLAAERPSRGGEHRVAPATQPIAGEEGPSASEREGSGSNITGANSTALLSETLEATHESLIPLEEDDHEAQEREREVEEVQDAINIARELGREDRIVAAAISSSDADHRMEIDDIVDELLERQPGDRRIIIGELSHSDEDDEDDDDDPTMSESAGSTDSVNRSEEEDEGQEDRCNSVGEEIEDEEFDDSHVEQGHGLSDTNFHGTSTEGDDDLSDADSQSSTVADEEASPDSGGTSISMGEDAAAAAAAEVDGEDIADADDIFEDEEEEDDEGEEEELDLEYGEEMDDVENDYMQLNFPHFGIPWRSEFDPLDHHHHHFLGGGGGISLFSRSGYQTRPAADPDSASSQSGLPQFHPLLVHHFDQSPHHQVVGAAATTPAAVATAPYRSGFLAVDLQRSNIVQQMLTNISTSVGTEEVLSFNVGSGNPQRTSAVRVVEPLSLAVADDSAESTFIPSNLSRWREESNALDVSTASFCVAAVRTELVARLSEIFEREQAEGQAVAAMERRVPQSHPESVPHAERLVPTAPNPSDEVTPSAPTPQATSTAVESLQSSLLAVADALAQTVVRMDQSSGGGDTATVADSEPPEARESATGSDHRTAEMEEGAGTDAVPEPPMLEAVPLLPSSSDRRQESVGAGVSLASAFDGPQASARATLANTNPSDPLHAFLSAVAGEAGVTLPRRSDRQAETEEGAASTSATITEPPPPNQQPDSSAGAGPSVLSTFDGSQESARAALASINPTDPLYTFLSAVAGAPAPPLPNSSLEPSSARSPSSSLSPRLPIFTQLQSTPSSAVMTSAASPTVGGALPIPVIQGPRTVGQTTQSAGGSSTVAVPQLAVAPPTSSPSNSSQGSSEHYPAAASADPWQPTIVAVSDTQMDEGGSPLPPRYSQSAASAAADSLPLPAPTTTATTSSPSPSDTLAPLLLTSLQVAVTWPPGGGTTAHPSNGSERGRPQDHLPADREVNSNQNVTPPSLTSHIVIPSAHGRAAATGGSSGQVVTGPPGQVAAEEVASRVARRVTSQVTSEQAAGAGASSATREEGEEIDPAFLAALPEAIRQEVLHQHERERRLREQPVTISPEFLAALPPDIQDEVIQHELLRQASQSSDPAQPTDATIFLHSLAPDLRRTILSEMDDSVMSFLPADIAAEAQRLRQEREARRRQILEQRQAMYEQMRVSHAMPPWLHEPGHRFTMFQHPALERDHHIGGMSMFSTSLLYHPASQRGEQGSKQILDQEGLACLMVLLFLDEPKLHFNRLFRIFRNLSQHFPTRAWLIRSLISILKEAHFSPAVGHVCPSPAPLLPAQGSSQSAAVASSGTLAHVCPPPGQEAGQAATPSSSAVPTIVQEHMPHWLKVGVNAALGSHASTFHFAHAGKLGSATTVHVHPHASVPICNNVLDLLIFLARQFPSSFLPLDLLPTDKSAGGGRGANSSADVVSNFWQVLLRLDSSASRKGKSSLKAFQLFDASQDRSEVGMFSSSPMGHLMSLFTHPVIQNSVSLVDKLLRALSVVSGSIPKQGLSRSQMRTPQAPPPLVVELQQPLEQRPSDGATAGDRKWTESSSVVSVDLINSAVRLLTSGKCNEESLDDATSLLINLSRCSAVTRETILRVLLEGVRSIGRCLCDQISVLMDDITGNEAVLALRRASATTSEEVVLASSSSSVSSQQPALGTAEGVVLPTWKGEGPVVDHSQDLHLPTMGPLTCKGSQQSFFLRLLKVVCQLRESALSASSQARGASSASSLLASAGGGSQSSSAPVASSSGDVPSTQSQASASSAATTGATAGSSGPQLPESDVKQPFASTPSLSLLLELDELWIMLSNCLDALAATYDPHAVLVLQPTVEAFFLVHADQSEEGRPAGVERRSSSHHSRSRRLPSFHTISDTESIPGSPAPYDVAYSPLPGSSSSGAEMEGTDPYAHLPPDTARFLKFAERHRTVLNQILRQSTIPLSEGPFAVLVNHTRLLDFDVKRRYFRQELEQLDEGLRREDLVIHLRRDHVFEDTFRELYRRNPEEMKANLYITFEGEEGQDAGGLLREWYLIIAREMFNPNYALFKTTPGDRVTYMPNPSSHVNPDHLNYFKFVGRIIAKAIYDNKLLDCFFTRSFYKHILGKPVHYTDMESEDYAFYQGMVFLLQHDLNEIDMDLTFSTEIQEFGKTEIRDLKPNGRELPVTEANKREYVQLACQMKMTGSIRSQIKSFLEGFYEVIPKSLISIFNEQELELLISGLPSIDIDDLRANSEYHKYTTSSLQIQWFWRALRDFDQADRARFLQFVTGTSKVPLQGFAALEGMNGVQKFQIHRDDRSTDRLPCAHTCFNQLDLPPYETYDKLRKMLLTAIRECPEGFGLA